MILAEDIVLDNLNGNWLVSYFALIVLCALPVCAQINDVIVFGNRNYANKKFMDTPELYSILCYRF